MQVIDKEASRDPLGRALHGRLEIQAWPSPPFSFSIPDIVAGSSVRGMISKARGAWPCDKAQCILVQVQPHGLEQ